jgi:hypothetical protein
MAFPVTLNGRTYTLTDFEGTNYVDGLPDAFEDFVTQAGQIYSTTSTTSNSIGTGSKTFTVEASKPYQVGTPLRIADTAAVSTNWIDGIVTAYSGTTLTVNAVAYAGSGTKTAWSINIGGGPIAYTGTLPIAQGGTGATTAAAAQTNLDVYSKADADSRFLNVSGEASDVVLNGDLTVDTDTLYVDSANNRVGINTTTPSAELHVNSGASNFAGLFESTDSGATITLIDNGTTGGSAAEQGLNTVGDQLEIRAVADLSFETGAVERLSLRDTVTIFNEAGNAVDFRVESANDSSAFFIDGTNGHVAMSSSDPATLIPQSFNAGKRSFVNELTGGTQFIASRKDTVVAAGDYIGGYLFKTNDASINRFGGMIATADDVSGNGNLEFYPVSAVYESGSEGLMQLDDAGDLYLMAGNILAGRTHANVYSTEEQAIIAYNEGDGAGNTSATEIRARDGTGGDQVFRHNRRGTVKSEIEENGDFLSATGSYGATSDQRLKENIVASGSQWDDIKALQIKKYSMIEDGLDAPNKLGVIAQDLQASGMNGLVKQHFKTDTDDNPVLDADGNQEEYLSVKYSVLYMKAIKALQEAMDRIETLEAKVAALEAN